MVKEGGGECSSDIMSATEFGGQECTVLVWIVVVVCWKMKMIHIPCVLSHILDHSKEQSSYGPLGSVEAFICALSQFWDFINLRIIALTNFLIISQFTYGGKCHHCPWVPLPVCTSHSSCFPA
jgi:hypothetical protein